MAVQQRRNSKTRKAKRRTHYKLAAPTLVDVYKRQVSVQGRSAACGFHSGGGPDIRDDENDGGCRKF